MDNNIQLLPPSSPIEPNESDLSSGGNDIQMAINILTKEVQSINKRLDEFFDIFGNLTLQQNSMAESVTEMERASEKSFTKSCSSPTPSIRSPTTPQSPITPKLSLINKTIKLQNRFEVLTPATIDSDTPSAPSNVEPLKANLALPTKQISAPSDVDVELPSAPLAPPNQQPIEQQPTTLTLSHQTRVAKVSNMVQSAQSDAEPPRAQMALETVASTLEPHGFQQSCACDVQQNLRQAQLMLEQCQSAALNKTNHASVETNVNQNLHPVQPPVIQQPLQPLVKQQIESTAKKTLIMSDSTCRNIRKNDVKNLVNKQREDVDISKHPGATADQIKSYLNWWYDNYSPDTLVVCAGANDLLYENGRCKRIKEDLCNEPKVVDKLMDIGREAKLKGGSNIYFCKLYTIRDLYDGYTSRFNELLERRCNELGFYSISNSNIELSDLSDGLHVDSKHGHAKLKHNIMKSCETYIHRNVRNIVSKSR